MTINGLEISRTDEGKVSINGKAELSFDEALAVAVVIQSLAREERMERRVLAAQRKREGR